jgi:hypothetical protein
MSKVKVVARVLEDDHLECKIDVDGGKKLSLTGLTTDVDPVVEGSGVLKKNRALIDNAWALAKFTYLKVNLASPEEQENAAKRAKAHQEEAEWIAELAAAPGVVSQRGWCSSCFEKATHNKVERPTGQTPAYLCQKCGAPTLPCADPRCDNMAVRERGRVRIPRFCAEHRHDIPSFKNADATIEGLEEWEEFFKYEQPNLSRNAKIGGSLLAGLAVVGTAGVAAAPAIGGALGTLVGGYSGAAATSYGLALLGGGSLAAGGLGMAGGTVVVAAVGAALGGAVGASVTNAYVREDKSFRIEMLKSGTGVPVVVCNGFLSEGSSGWGEWRELISSRYPDSPVYKLHWGAKELKDLGILGGYASVKIAAPAAVKAAAMSATKQGAKKLLPAGPALLFADLVKNPWHVAKSRADKTGVVLADLLARTTTSRFVLVGHSLGARVMAIAAESLGTKEDGPRLEAVHLTGAAIGANSDWGPLVAGVDDAVYNYFSSNDKVLKYLYQAAMGGQRAAGQVGFSACPAKLINIDVSSQVDRHSDYYTKIKLR